MAAGFALLSTCTLACDCPKRFSLELVAEQKLAVGELDTVIAARSSSDRPGHGHLDFCSADTLRITRYRWDLDGDGEFELTGKQSLQHVHLTSPGRYTFTVEVRDEEGEKGTSSVVLTVLGATSDTELLNYTQFLVGGGPNGCRELCIMGRTDLASLTIDSVTVLDARDRRVLLELNAFELEGGRDSTRCGKIAEDVTPGSELIVVARKGTATREQQRSFSIPSC